MAMDRSYGIDAPVEARVDAFRGSPEKLEQRYAQAAKPNFLDLLALQKIKSEKEAAMRDMQLKMAAQQAKNGGLATLYDQREQEVMDLTKQELAQQQQGLMQQRDKTMRERMQNMLMGIAQNPAPNVTQLAGGGIVAFAEGGKSEEETAEEKAEREQQEADAAALRQGLRKTGAAAMDILTLPVRGVAGAFETAVTRPARAAGIPIPYLSRDFYGGDASSMTPYMDKIRREEKAAVQPARRGGDEADVEAQAGYARPAPQPAPQPAPAQARPRPPVAPQPAAPAAPGIQMPPKSSFQSNIEERTSYLANRDPMQMSAERGRLMEQAQMLSPEELKARQDYMARMQAELAKRTSPEQDRRSRLRALAMGAANKSTYSSMGGGIGAAMEAYERGQQNQRIADMESIEKMRSGIADIPRLAKIKGLEFGDKAFELGEQGLRQGVASGASLSESIARNQFNYAQLAEQKRSGDLDRIIRDKEVAATNALRAAQAAANDQAKIQNAILATEKLLNEKKKLALAPYAQELQFLTMQRMAASGAERDKLNTEIKRITDIAEAEYQRDSADIQATLEALYNKSVGSVTGFKVEREK